MQKIGIILLFIGIGIMVLFWGAGIIAFLVSPEVPAIAKIAAFCLAGGILLLVISAIKENFGKKDKYEEITK